MRPCSTSNHEMGQSEFAPRTGHCRGEAGQIGLHDSSAEHARMDKEPSQREETGLAVVAEALPGIYFDDQLDLHFFVFRCRRLDEALAPVPTGSEIAACAFWPAAALPRPMSDLTIRRIHDALSGVAGPLPVVARPRHWLS